MGRSHSSSHQLRWGCLTSKAPKDEDEAALWQAILLSEASSLPFPVTYETNEDMTWFLNDKGRICVSFNGLADHTFEIYCDQRQLHWLKRFLEDQQIKKTGKNQHSAALFTLRSARIAWQKGQKQGDPWTAHQLTLFCTIETDFWTTAGTEKLRQEKATECAKILESTKAKKDLTANQEAFIRRREKMLTALDTPFPRSNRPLYRGNPAIIAGVSYGLDRPATLAIVNVETGKAITYRSIRQLLGDSYNLLNRYRSQQQRHAHQRHNNQRRGASSQIQESNLGEYLDRLIAKAIVLIAKQYQANSIVLPQTANLREIIQLEVQTRAEQRIPGYLEGQQRYAKEYRAAVHRWSYSRLTANIQSQAAQIGIAVETAQQTSQGTPQEKAKHLVLTAYSARGQLLSL
ncbi:MAG: type V CRISPR-associated protein Cas12k [Elainella sp.]